MLETVKTFNALSEEFVELFMRHYPVAATRVGIHDYDASLPDDSPEGLRERASWMRDLEQRLAASVPVEELPTEARTDHALLRSRIAAIRSDLEEIKTSQKNPCVALNRGLDSMRSLLARPFAPFDERKESLVARMMTLPDYLAGAARNLDVVPPMFLEAGIELAGRGPAFVDEVVRHMLRTFPGEAERLEHAGDLARKAFLQYQDYLEKELRPKAGGSFAIGERWLHFRFQREHLLSMTVPDLDRAGRQYVEHTLIVLEEEARRRDPSKTWRQIADDARRRLPEPSWLREAYLGEIERAREFVRERRIAPMAPGERMEVADTPALERSQIPYAAYQAPAPFDLDQTGLLWITPIDLRKPRDEQALQLEGHCTPRFTLTSVREGYPGRHLIAGHANRAATRLRRLASSPLLLGGWPLYVADLMWEMGFYTMDPLTRLLQLQDLLLASTRVVVDTGLHTNRMTYEEGCAYLVETAGIDEGRARFEVRRIAMTPTRASGAMLGHLSIVELRQELSQLQGGKHDMHEFHGALLSAGALPPALLREEICERLGVPSSLPR